MTRKVLLENYTNSLIPNSFDYKTLIDVLKKNDYEISILYNLSKNNYYNGLSSISNSNIVIFQHYKNSIPLLIKSIFFFIINILVYKNEILSYRIGNVLIGDVIYDSILRDENLFTLNFSFFKYKTKILKSILYTMIYQRIVTKGRYDLLIISHLVYDKFLNLARICHINRIPVILYTGIGLILYNDFSRPLYYHEIEFDLGNVLNNLNNKRLLNDIDNLLYSRINLLTNNPDILRAKKEYDNNNSYIPVDEMTYKSIVLIACHVFKDGPHHSRNHIFDDYFQWLDETLEAAKKNTSTLFIIKEHPSSAYYKENGIVDSLLTKHYSSNLVNYKLINDKSSLLNRIDGLITHSGTLGIEYSAIGIPVMLAGKPFYSDFGFTIDFKTKADYLNYVSNVNGIKKMNRYQIRFAKLIFYSYHQMAFLFESDENYELIQSKENQNKLKVHLESIFNILA
jgi:calcineurin-like phosphoesterase family protein